MLYPIQNNFRNKLDISGIWDFKCDPDWVGEKEGWANGLTGSRPMAVPGSWNEQYDDLFGYFDLAWYVKKVYVPSCWQGQRVFIRADLNVPQDDAGRITEDTRIRASIPCIQMALDAGAAVMVTSHLGRPTEGEFKPEDSLAPVAARLSELLGREVPLVANWVDGVTVVPPPVNRLVAA